jgi:hypothetical protein
VVYDGRPRLYYPQEERSNPPEPSLSPDGGLDFHTTIDNDDSPRENGYIESFDGKMGDELLIREIFFTFEEVKILITRWREEYNHIRPHSALGYRPPTSLAWSFSQQPINCSSGLT